MSKVCLFAEPGVCVLVLWYFLYCKLHASPYTVVSQSGPNILRLGPKGESESNIDIAACHQCIAIISSHCDGH